tara:strand:+ start:506 stop:778 length:273 start_codon:yes stop_codon:yes gene_type:complete
VAKYRHDSVIRLDKLVRKMLINVLLLIAEVTKLLIFKVIRKLITNTVMLVMPMNVIRLWLLEKGLPLFTLLSKDKQITILWRQTAKPWKV